MKLHRGSLKFPGSGRPSEMEKYKTHLLMLSVSPTLINPLQRGGYNLLGL
jgi:hypothetical protein